VPEACEFEGNCNAFPTCFICHFSSHNDVARSVIMQQDLTASCRSPLKYFQSPFHLRFANACFAPNTKAHKTSSGCFRWRWQTTFCHLCHFCVILVSADHFDIVQRTYIFSLFDHMYRVHFGHAASDSGKIYKKVYYPKSTSTLHDRYWKQMCLHGMNA